MTDLPAVDIASRESLIAWLIANDPNGCYADDECTEELGAPASLETLRFCYRLQTTGCGCSCHLDALADCECEPECARGEPFEACYHCSKPIVDAVVYDGSPDDAPAYHRACYDTAVRLGLER